MTLKALDLFAGAGGWDVAATALGWDVDGVEIMDAARATREAAGFRTIASDVRTVHPERGQYDLLLASPPCQTYSMAGKGDGRRNLDAVLAALQTPEDLSHLDERTALVLEPLRIGLAAMPRVMAWEQVPAVLPVWAACASVLRDHGYSVVCEILNAEQYGVPQTRRRAVLIARRDAPTAMLPIPMHSRFHARTPARLDDGVLPWVSMAEALGWTETMEVVSNYGTGGDPRNRGTRSGGQPSATITSKADRTKLRNGSDGRKIQAVEAAALQTFPPGFPFQGNKGNVFQQIGNAVPPLLAHAILAPLVTP